ncbi:MAG: hypothetical protein QHI48_00500 [Bacteroidota bacterium]|nr:hypothetical protein [Bacteroidota bacterium]
MKRFPFIAILVLLATVRTASAQVGDSPKTDPRLIKALKEANLEYTELPNGDCKLLVTTSDEEGDGEESRTQIVFIRSSTYKLGNIEIREISSVGWDGAEEPSALVANTLLQGNAQSKIGAWEVSQMRDSSYIAVFTVKTSPDIAAETLETIVFAVAYTADRMEKKLKNKDEW